MSLPLLARWARTRGEEASARALFVRVLVYAIECWPVSNFLFGDKPRLKWAAGQIAKSPHSVGSLLHSYKTLVPRDVRSYCNSRLLNSARKDVELGSCFQEAKEEE